MWDKRLANCLKRCVFYHGDIFHRCLKHNSKRLAEKTVHLSLMQLSHTHKSPSSYLGINILVTFVDEFWVTSFHFRARGNAWPRGEGGSTLGQFG